MAGLMKRDSGGEATDVFGRFDRLFDEWARMMPFRPCCSRTCGRRET